MPVRHKYGKVQYIPPKKKKPPASVPSPAVLREIEERRARQARAAQDAREKREAERARALREEKAAERRQRAAAWKERSVERPTFARRVEQPPAKPKVGFFARLFGGGRKRSEPVLVQRKPPAPAATPRPAKAAPAVAVRRATSAPSARTIAQAARSAPRPQTVARAPEKPKLPPGKEGIALAAIREKLKLWEMNTKKCLENEGLIREALDEACANFKAHGTELARAHGEDPKVYRYYVYGDLPAFQRLKEKLGESGAFPGFWGDVLEEYFEKTKGTKEGEGQPQKVGIPAQEEKKQQSQILPRPTYEEFELLQHNILAKQREMHGKEEREVSEARIKEIIDREAENWEVSKELVEKNIGLIKTIAEDASSLFDKNKNNLPPGAKPYHSSIYKESPAYSTLKSNMDIDKNKFQAFVCNVVDHYYGATRGKRL